jgi:hypothetical protein
MDMKTSFVRGIAVATLGAIGLWNGSALAAAPPPVPQTLQQQGRILDSDGAPVSSKVHFVFNVYAKASGGAALWTEEQDITLDDGYFSTELGLKTALADVFDGSTLYLGVTVGNDDEMAPRQTISSVPYALLAGSAVSALSADTVAFTALSGIPAPCAAGQYLKGYSAVGVASCATLPALSCRVPSTSAAGVVASQGCDAGEVMTGGGCSTNGSLTSSYQNVCISNLVVTPLSAGAPVEPTAGPVVGICAFGTGDNLWTCKTASSASIRAYATCCKVQ